MTNIRPYVAIYETIERTAPNILGITMPTAIVGPSVLEEKSFKASLNFSHAND